MEEALLVVDTPFASVNKITLFNKKKSKKSKQARKLKKL